MYIIILENYFKTIVHAHEGGTVMMYYCYHLAYMYILLKHVSYNIDITL